jgi:HD-GYP domain-containing protein (c-di-GMP phosphodiesterase class II)
VVIDAETLRAASYVGFALTVIYAGWLLVTVLRGRQAGDGPTGVMAWSRQMDDVEGYPPGHGERVAAYAVALGEKYGLDAETIDALHHAGLLHDVGELEMTFLAQPGALTADETTQLWQHPIIGEQLLREAGLETAAPIVRHHHERWDGTGYPDRLRGEAIPLPARILAVADAFEAFTHDRPYRPGFGPAGALEEIKRRAGTLLDPQVVAVFCQLQDADVPEPVSVEF